MKPLVKRIVTVAVVLAVGLLLVLAFRPEPVAVEVARVARGALQVTVDEEGETRIHHRYVLGAPVAGNLERIGLHPGDPVAAGQLVARLDPLPLDARAREQAEARHSAARAAKQAAEAGIRSETAALDEAKRTLARLSKLAGQGVVSTDDLDRARTAERLHASALEAARFRAETARFEMESARAALLEADAGGVVPLASPIAGSVLEVCEECARVVQAGTPLLTVGNPQELEVVVDVLSSDAVKIEPGAVMLLTAGGDNTEVVRARVRLVEPAGFTKVSPLGVEEQRVNVVGDFVDPPGRLGDRYRVEAKIVLWEAKNVLKVPSGALYRQGDGWAVFVLENGRARARTVQVGHRNADEAEVLSGLEQGDTVIVHPGDRVEEGVRVEVVG